MNLVIDISKDVINFIHSGYFATSAIWFTEGITKLSVCKTVW